MTAETIKVDTTLLAEHSARTIAAIHDSYLEQAVAKGQFADEAEADETIRGVETEIRDKHALTINMSAGSVQRLAIKGSIETFWDHAEEVGADAVASTPTANGKSIHPRYVAYRRAADDALRTFAPDDATGKEPIFAAVAGPRELISGAAPEYGNWHAVLDESLAERAVYNFSDSHTSVVKSGEDLIFNDATVLGYDDALTAKAISELYLRYTNALGYGRMGSFALNVDPDRLMTIQGASPGYIEAAVFDEVPLDKVSAIHGNLNTPEDLATASTILNDPGVLRDKLRVDCGAAVDPLTKSWIASHFEGETPRSTEVDPDAEAAWQKLGLTPEATYDEVATALNQQISERWPGIARAVYGSQARHFRVETYRNPKQWGNYLAEARSWQTRAAIRPEQRESIKELLRLQEAAVFFNAPAK